MRNVRAHYPLFDSGHAALVPAFAASGIGSVWLVHWVLANKSCMAVIRRLSSTLSLIGARPGEVLHNGVYFNKHLLLVFAKGV
jgi:hypothetical protein